MAHISKGKLLNVTFTDGLDCAWLTAYAEVFLCFVVEYRDILGANDMDVPLYRSRSEVVMMPQVRFLFCDRRKSAQLSKDLSMS